MTGARALTAGGDGRFDSAVATLADGREVAIRVADDDEAATELAAEALSLRALTAGTRAMLPFRAPEYIGETRLGESRALVTELLPGFQIEAAHVPAGRGAAESMGAAIAAVHMLPPSVVRGAGLATRTAEESRHEVSRLVDAAAATGHVPARLTVRWRGAVADDELWRFESCVVLGGVQATSFVFDDDPEHGPRVTGLLGWHGLSVGDPAVDLAWLSAAPDAADDVHSAYARTIDRTPDAALEVRARLRAELEFAQWLVHGDSLRRHDIVEDAAALLQALADGLQSDELTVAGSPRPGVDSALDALDRVPAGPVSGIDTSMQTDAYNPDDLWREESAEPDRRDDAGPWRDGTGTPATDARGRADDDGSAGDAARRIEIGSRETEDLSDLRTASSATHDRADAALAGPIGDALAGTTGDDAAPEDEAQRAARAALQRWKSSASE